MTFLVQCVAAFIGVALVIVTLYILGWSVKIERRK